jgi:ParB/RepB/Spo0J family partition protein
MNNKLETAYLDISAADIDESYGRLRLVNPRGEANMVKSLKRFGQLTPVAVSSTGSGRYEMVDGFKRLRACRRLGLESMRARVMGGHSRVIKTAIVQLNRKGNSIRDVEEALIVQSLHREDQLDQVEIATLLGCDKSWVCRRIALVEKLSEEVVEHLKLGLITAAHCRELSQLPRGNHKEPLECVLKHRLTSRETRRLVTMLVERPRWEQEKILWLPLEILDDRHPPKFPKDTAQGGPLFDAAILKLEKSCNTFIRGIDAGLFLEVPKQHLCIVELVEGTLNRLKKLVREGPF